MNTIWIGNGKEEFRVKRNDIKWTRTPHFPSCIQLDLLDNMKQNFTPVQIKFQSKRIANLGISLLLADRNTALEKRPLKSQLKMYIGPRIEINNLMIIQSEKNTAIKCVNYPTTEYKSYKDCDEAFVYGQMKTIYKIMPFWATSNFDEVTKLK